MIYKILNSNYLFNKKSGFHVSEKWLLFTTKSSFSAEIGMNICTILVLVNNYAYQFFDLENFRVIIFSLLIVPALPVFAYVKNHRIISENATKAWRVTSFLYRVFTYFIFFYLILKINFR